MPHDLKPPVAPIVPTSVHLHGEDRSDDYAYLRNRENPAVTAYLDAENAYTAAMMRHTEELQETLYQEMLGRIKEDDSQVPVRRGAWWYYSRTETGKAYPIFCRRRATPEPGGMPSAAEMPGTLNASEVPGTPDTPEEIYFDQNAAAEGHPFYELGGFEVSPDHRYLAILEDTNGYEDFTLRVKDLQAGAFLPDRVEKLGAGLAWASDNTTILYLTTDAAKRNNQIWRHRVGDDPARAVSVYRDDDVLFNVGISRARSGAFLWLTSGSFTSTEIWALDATHPDTAPRCIAPRAPGVEYDVEHGGDWVYVLTNRDGARNFKVMRAPVSDPGRWEEWLPHRPEVFVERIDVFHDHLVVQERQSGLRQLRVTVRATGDAHYVTFPDVAYGVFLGWNPEFTTRTLRFTYSSFITPSSVYDYDMDARTRVLRKREEVLGGYDPSRYQIERLTATARDGTAVPISLVYRAPLVRDGARPLLLYAYGSYGATMEPTFNSLRFSLIDRGFIYAIAHVRGGEEMGRHWYDDGKMMRKMNTFFDFIDCAEYLVRERYTSSDRLAAHGGSAGGLLMGVIANLRPDVFRTIVADVPFVDVINTMLDASIPLTAQEWEQWGNPRDAEAYRYLRRYSPYDNVTRQSYPRLLVTSGVNDSRVAFWEPAKWVAKLRTLKTDTNPLLLKMHMGAGHGGASGRYERLREQAFRYAFILDQTVPGE